MNVLIIGKNSYIGTSFIKYCSLNSKYHIEEFDSRSELTPQIYSGFDVVIHLAGIAHVSAKKSMKDMYMKINRDLAKNSASYAKEARVKKFIFMSSMIVYGEDESLRKEKHITLATKTNPNTFYGFSKLEADEYIQSLNCENFKTCVIRSPMVYGDDCKGNYPRLKKLGEKLPIIPKFENKRSVIRIDNLCKFFCTLIEDENLSGLFFPQDKEYMVTYKVMENARAQSGKKVRKTKLFNPLIRIASICIRQLRKMYGTKIYEIGNAHENGLVY